MTMWQQRFRGLALLAAAAIGMTMGCGPIGPFSGGRLSGDPGPGDVSDWSQWSRAKTIKLETRPDDPHSVTTWFVAIGPALYVPTSLVLGTKNPSDRDWVANVEADPRVRIRLAGVVYERTAVRVTDAVEFDAARSALESKYERDPARRDPKREIWIYRMVPR